MVGHQHQVGFRGSPFQPLQLFPLCVEQVFRVVLGGGEGGEAGCGATGGGVFGVVLGGGGLWPEEFPGRGGVLVLINRFLLTMQDQIFRMAVQKQKE